MSKIDIVSFWNSSGNIGMAPYVNTTSDGGHIDYEGVYSKVDLNTRMQSIVSALPDFFESYTIKLTDVNLSGVLVSKAECVLKASSSESPDYTQILTDINSNLTDLNSKFVNNTNINICRMLESLYNCFNGSGPIESSDTKRASSYIRRILLSLCGTSSTSDTNIINGSVSVKASQLIAKLQQSVSPNASITDVISALNTTIDSKQDTTIVNNDNTNLVQVEGVLDYRLKPQDTM